MSEQNPPNETKATAPAPDEKAVALSALRAALNPTLHTDNCAEIRSMGVRKCTRVCGGIRAAVELLSGSPLGGSDWPGERAPDNPPDTCAVCGDLILPGLGGYCPRCGAPFLMTKDPATPHRVHVSLNVSTEELPAVLGRLRELTAGRQASYGLTSTSSAEGRQQTGLPLNE